MVKEKAEFVCEAAMDSVQKLCSSWSYVQSRLQPAGASLLMSNCTLIPQIKAFVWEFRAAGIPMFEFKSESRCRFLHQLSLWEWQSRQSPMDKLEKATHYGNLESLN